MTDTPPKPAQRSTAELDARAREILAMNDRGGYTVPTDGLYPYQWNWDSVFAAFGFAVDDLPRAWQELETLFAGQWNNGMVPHILFHKVDPSYFPGPNVWQGIGPIPSSGISQPPVAATVIRMLMARDHANGQAKARWFFPRLMDWHRWFHDWRTENGAIVVTHPWETGRDNSPDWDAPFAAIEPEGVGDYERRDTSHVNQDERPHKYQYDRYLYLVKLGTDCGWDEAHLRTTTPFRVADPTMTFILLRANRDLRAMAVALGEPTEEIDSWIAGQEAGAETLWNEAAGTYDTLDIRSGTFGGGVSNAAFLSWYAGLRDDRMLPQYDRITGLVTYPVPSYDPAHPAFEAQRYWRGPVWAMMNMMTAAGLQEAGHKDRAATLRRKTADLIAANGFAEYFNPQDGSPAGGRTFTWTAAVWLGWASPVAGRDTWAASN